MSRTISKIHTFSHTKGVWKLLPTPKPLILLVRLGGFEPPTNGLEVRCSIP
jgi:hypothetical protein